MTILTGALFAPCAYVMTRVQVLAGALLVFTAATAHSAAPSPDSVGLPLEFLASRPVIRVSVNKQGPFPFLIVGDETPTLIDAALAEALKLKERRAGAATPEPTVEIAFGAKAPLTVPVQVADITRYMPNVGVAVRPRGVISLSAWKDHLVTLDYARWRVTFEPGTLPEPNGKDVFALNGARELRLPLTVGDHAIDCRVDPLFTGGLLVPSVYVAQVPVEGVSGNWSSFTTSDGPIHAKEARLGTNLMLGPFELKTPMVLLADRGETATVGMQWLTRFSITYDMANARARVERPHARSADK
jgi:hypothetical protein